MKSDSLRRDIIEFLKFDIPEISPQYKTVEHEKVDESHRLRISYTSEEGDEIPAYLLVPDGDGPFSAVLVHHQHHGQRHFGKSEVCGLVGDPLQAFGSTLVKQGIIVLAPDSICFEDRRKNRTGIVEDEEGDVAQHYHEMCYRLLQGDTLMRKVLSDSAQAISFLCSYPLVDPERVGILGHSYGGTTALFHGALDERIHFACSSGAASSYQYKIANDIGIEMSMAIPGFAVHFDISDLVACFVPRQLLIVSATEDVFSKDADLIIDKVRKGFPENQIEHKRYSGGHSLTRERFDDIVSWVARAAI